MDRLSDQISRRRFLKLAGGTMAAAGLAPVLAACGGGGSAGTTAAAAGGGTTAAAGGGNLKLWWWGDQEAVGIKKWMDDTISKFQQESGYTIDPLLVDTSNVIPGFDKAAAAGKPADIQFIFNGIYHMQEVWLGYLSALNGLVSDDVIKNSGATVLSNYQGKTYRAGFYGLGFGFAYNKDLFDKAGLNADSPPTTWDDFLNTLDKLKTSGVIPIGGGIKDGFWGEWYFVNTLTQNLDTPADALNLFIGDLDWRDPKYHEHWVKLQELHDHGFINDDINSLDLYPGIQLTQTGKAAMSIDTSADLPNFQDKLGKGNIGYFIFPTFGTGKMAGIPIVDTQGFGIPSKASDQQGAAKFIDFMHTPERINAMYTTSRAIPADSRFDASLIDDPFLKSVYDNWFAAQHNVYIADLMPQLFWTDAMFVASQKILAGDLTGEQSGELAAQVTEKWKQQNPDIVQNYTTWAADLKA